jgi:hypothetical protein
MAYNKTQKNKIITEICDMVGEGATLRSSLEKVKISSKTFYQWLDADEEKVKQYTRATELRAESMVDEILAIADDNEGDYKEDGKVNHENVHRSRLRVDTRKWLMSKMMPTKYGDKVALDVNDDTVKKIQIEGISDSKLKKITKKGG